MKPGAHGRRDGGDAMGTRLALPLASSLVGKSSVLWSIVGRDFLHRDCGIVTRQPLVLQLHKLQEKSHEHEEFLHMPQKQFTNFYNQFDSIVKDIEDMVCSNIEKPNSIILAISPANQDIATLDAVNIAKEVDPNGDHQYFRNNF